MAVCVRVRPLSNTHESKARQKSTGTLKEVVRVSKTMSAVQVQRLAKPGAVLRSEQAAQWNYLFDSAFVQCHDEKFDPQSLVRLELHRVCVRRYRCG